MLKRIAYKIKEATGMMYTLVMKYLPDRGFLELEVSTESDCPQKREKAEGESTQNLR